VLGPQFKVLSNKNYFDSKIKKQNQTEWVYGRFQKSVLKSNDKINPKLPHGYQIEFTP